MIRAIGNIGWPRHQKKDSKPWLSCGGNILKSVKKLNRDFKEFLALLLEEKVEFLLVGGYAVAFHGYPRFTGDMDILVGNDPGNAAKILLVLQKFGFGKPSISQSDLQTKGNVIQLGFPPVRIDLITSLDGVTNEEVFSDRIRAEFYGLSVPMISKPHLLQNKRATGRPRDLLDLENLQ
ncbi:MAG: nucleotidyltransferase [Fibrobacterota bacterium]|nr:nucleotidyltransferase [Fibrobacterota bacterium]